MKTLKTLVSSALTAIVLSTTVFTSFAAEVKQPFELSASHADIKKVILTGNVRVFLVQSRNESVVVAGEYPSEDLSIEQTGNALRIASKSNIPVTVTVYVKDLFRIDACDKAVVKTSGKFNVKFLQVMLRGNAIARLKTTTESIYTATGDNAHLELLGTTAQHIVKTEGESVLNTEKFAALKTEQSADQSVAMNAEKTQEVIKAAAKTGSR